MRIVISISVLALALSVTDASAACPQARLAGNWHYFANNVVVNDDGSANFTFIEDCTFRIDAAGAVRNVQCIDPTVLPAFDGATVQVNPDCSIGFTNDSCVLGGQIARNRQTVSRNADCCCFEDVPGSGSFVLNYQNSFTLGKTTPAWGVYGEAR